MKPFEYLRPAGLDQAGTLARAEGAALIAGGTNLVDLMKLQVETPRALVDLGSLSLDAIADVDAGMDGAQTGAGADAGNREAGRPGLRIGALATNTAIAVHPRVRADYPVLARAILSGATQQLRNKATTAGNLGQRTRCYYFMNIDQPCNKRAPGSGCGALKGIARLHAVLGTSDACIATYPGDMAVALAALGARVEILGADGGTREVSARAFHRLPGDTPWRDNVLEPGDIVTAVILPPPVGGLQIYRKVRERSSYAFALVSVAAVIELAEGRFTRADLAFGGLAHKPWHDPRIGEALVGEEPGPALFDRAADLLLADARGFGENDFKIPLARRTLHAVLAGAVERAAAAGATDATGQGDRA